jgi:hypothetical protein
MGGLTQEQQTRTQGFMRLAKDGFTHNSDNTTTTTPEAHLVFGQQ